MKLAFAVGSIGGLAGSVALAARSAVAVPILLASLVGYLALYAGDYAHGVFLRRRPGSTFLGIEARTENRLRMLSAGSRPL